jgi:hypothetical protein
MSEIMEQAHSDNWSFYNGDCVYFTKTLPDNCIDMTVYSPPFSSLYVYSESIADMGNVSNDQEFIDQYRYLVREKLRVTRPGRLTAIHVKDLVYYQNSSEDGSSGLRPFSDMCTQVHLEEGWNFHCRITIFRDPVLERAKTNAHGLLWKTFQKDATFCRVGMPEYLLVFRKWAKEGEEDLIKPVQHPKSEMPLEIWQELASPVWNYRPGQSGRGDYDMPATNVLNVKEAKDDKAEKHLCPMPLNITKRALTLWSNKGDTIYSPFGGIGSEGVSALSIDRKYIGCELHPIYYNQAILNLEQQERAYRQPDLFDF